MRHMRSLISQILALSIGDYSRPDPAPKPIPYPSMFGHLRHTAPGSPAPQLYNLPPRRVRRQMWRNGNRAIRAAGKVAPLKWHQTDFRHDGQHRRTAA